MMMHFASTMRIVEIHDYSVMEDSEMQQMGGIFISSHTFNSTVLSLLQSGDEFFVNLYVSVWTGI
jgi:hypothetical protein